MRSPHTALALLALLAGFTAQAQAYANPAPVVLLTAGDFTILAKTGISTSGVTSITGDIGVSPSLAVALTGFSQTMDGSNQFSTSVYVAAPGKLYAPDYAVPTPAKMTQAVSDMEAAYTNAAGRAADATGLGTPPGSIAGLTFVRGVYQWSSNVDISGDIFITGSATDIFIFQITGNLLLATGIQVQLSGGALPENIFWQVAGQATLNGGSTMNGNILSQTAIIMQSLATLNGKALAQSAVTLIANTLVSAAGPGPSGSPTDSPTASPTPSDSPTASPSPSPSPSNSPSPSPSNSPSPSPSNSPSPSPSNSPSPSPSNSPSPSPSNSPSPSLTISPSDTPSASPSPSPTASPSAGSATATPSPSTSPTPGGSPLPVILGGADGFSILGGSGITNTNASSIDGYAGTYPTTTFAGSGSVTQSCTDHGGDSFTQVAKTDLQAAYNDASTRPSTTVPVELGGTTLFPGVYSQTSLQLTSGILTLDGQGNTNAVFIFYTGISTLTTAAGGSFNLINGAAARNVFWAVGSSATLGSGSAFVGTILALQSITMVSGATIEGRLLAINGAITLDNNNVTTSTSALVPCTGSGTPTDTPTSGATSTNTPSPNGTLTNTPTPSPTFTQTPSFTASPVVSPTPTFSASPTASITQTVSNTPTSSATRTETGSFTPSPILTATPTSTISSTMTVSPTISATSTASPVVSATNTGSPQATPSSGGSYIYPSPAKGDTATVAYELKESGEVTVKIHNQTGRLVDTVHDVRAAGWQSSTVTVGKFAPGTYYYVIYVRSSSGATEIQAPRKFVVLH